MSRAIAVYFNATERHSHGSEERNDVDLFRELLGPHLEDTHFVAVDPVHGDFPDNPTDFDGVILGGSSASLADNSPWVGKLLEQIKEMDEAKTRLFGICFGHQAIAHALGGVVEERPISLGAPNLELLCPQKWMHPYMPTLRLYAGNSQQVSTPPPSMRRIGMGKGNPNAMLAKDEHIASLQFHPEFTHIFMENYVDECLAKHRIDTHQYHAAKAEIKNHNDGAIMGKWMAKFFAR